MLLIRIICNVSLLVMISFSSRQKITTDKTIPVLLTGFGRPHSFAKFCPQNLSGIGIYPENLQKRAQMALSLAACGWIRTPVLCCCCSTKPKSQKPKASQWQTAAIFFVKDPHKFRVPNAHITNY